MSVDGKQNKKLPILSGRLQAIADLVTPTTKRVIDVGTDHAHLPIWLIGNGICQLAVAADLRKGPLQRAKGNIDKYSFSSLIETVLSDGLEKIKLQADDLIVIAGMGGTLIRMILDRELPQGLELILQPQNCIPELRQWLVQEHFEFLDEQLVADRKHIYVVIKVKKSNIYRENSKKIKVLSDIEAWLGPILINKSKQARTDNFDHKLWQNFLLKQRKTLLKTIKSKPALEIVLQQVETLLAK